jgi:uncharacterized protein
MTEMLYRSYAPELQVRSVGDGRTIFGTVVPYNAPARIDDNLVEQFTRGAFSHQLNAPQRVKLAREHVLLGGRVIGAGSLMRDESRGLYMELRVSKTPVGDETLELVRDGALDQLSIMFADRKSRQLAGGITERVRADLYEVAVVLQGAYGELASVAGVRSSTGGPQYTASEVSADQELRRKAEEFLALPDAADYDLELRRIRLGIPGSGLG